jgi:LPXTG-motif cell wall-anchored protein
MKNSRLILLVSLAVMLVLLLNSVNVVALGGLDTDRAQKLAFGHVLYVTNLTTIPEELTPGQPAQLDFIIENIATEFLKDLIIELELPSELAPYKGLNQFKIAEMISGETRNISFKIIPLPTAEEGVYKVNIVADYINYIGEERQDNQTISIIVASQPKIFAEIRSTEIYRGNNMGTVRIKIVNNNVANLKFLTVELNETNDFEIIGPGKDYIGDLNSDDFSEVSFKIKSEADKELVLPLILTYKNAMNQDFSEIVNLKMKIYSASELGIKNSNTWLILVILVIVIIGIWYYKKRKRMQRESKKLILR